MVSLDIILIHYDQNKELYLRVDSSPYGLGAVLCHKIVKVYKPIIFASEILDTAQKGYAHIEKEAIVFGVKHFNYYVWSSFRFDFGS